MGLTQFDVQLPHVPDVTEENWQKPQQMLLVCPNKERDWELSLPGLESQSLVSSL